MIDLFKFTENEWADNIKNRGIENLWSFQDSGTTGNGIINQINPEHFTISKILSKHSLFKKEDLFFLIRTIMFFAGDDKILTSYKNIATEIKKIIKKKNIWKLIKLLPSIVSVIPFLVSNLFSFKKRNASFKFAKYAPVIFKHKVGGHTFNFFQTVEVTNFEKTFCQENLDVLCKEKGLIITHNYFSSTINYQKGKLFFKENISKQNEINFEYLGRLIKNKEIWNPSISELTEFFECNSKIVYEYDYKLGKIISNKPNNTIIRYIKYA